MKKVLELTTLPVASVTEVKGELAEPLEEVVVGEGRGPADWDLSHPGDPRRPRGLSLQEFGGICLVS